MTNRGDFVRYLEQLSEGEPEIILDHPVINREANLEAMKRLSELQKVDADAQQCRKCQLCETRNNVVFGVGNPNADLMFIGEAPGSDEDRLGEPFVGRAGKLLDRIIAAMKLSRSEVYIANILKCRPPDNRNPSPDEVAECLPYLLEQTELIDPKIFVALGLVAATHLLNLPPNTSVKSLRGRIFEFSGKPLIVTYHPAALLRNSKFKAPAWEDIQRVMQLLSGELNWSTGDSLSGRE